MLIPNLNHYITENGINLWVRHAPSSNVDYLYVNIRVGGLIKGVMSDYGNINHYPPGIAHLVEHVVLDATNIERYSYHDRTLNGYTHLLNTSYSAISIRPSLEAWKSFIRCIFSPDISTSSVERQVEIASREVESYQRTLDFNILKTAVKHLYPNDWPYILITGDSQLISQDYNVSNIMSIIGNYYNPNVSTFVISSSVNANYLVDLIDELTCEYQRDNSVTSIVQLESPAHKRSIIRTDLYYSKTTFLLLSTLGDSKVKLTAQVNCQVILEMLFGYQNLIEQGQDHFTEIKAVTRSDFTNQLWMISIKLDQKINVDWLVERLCYVLTQIVRNDFGVSGLEFAKQTVLSQYLLSLNSIDRLNSALLMFESEGVGVEEYIKLVRDVKMCDIRSCANNMLKWSMVAI